ncbi:hypothetical protein Bhyg_12727, partial [Pseudolycoriella hygida]
CERHSSNMTSSLLSDPQTYLQDSENSIIKLKLKKPKSWNWELTTSKSSPNINFPKILLYDHKNNLLAETDKSDCIINDKRNNKLSNDKYAKSKFSSTSSAASNVNETKRPPKTIINSNCVYNNVDPKRNPPVQLQQNESFSHQSEIDGNSIGTPPSTLKYLDYRKRSLSGSFNEMKHFLNNFTSQLKRDGIDCKITNHQINERRHLQRISSSNEYRHLNKTFDGNQLRRIKSISDINQATKGSKRNLPEPTALMYNGKLSEKGPLENAVKKNQSKRLSSSCRTISNSANVGEIADTKAVSVGTDMFENDVYLAGNQTTFNRSNFLLKKSKSSMAVVSGGGDRPRNEKKKYRRTHSTNSLRFSSSILERISEFKCRSSSTESEEIGNQGAHSTENVPTKPRYFLRTSQAGTLVVCDDSFKNKKIRRRPRSYSKINENDEVDSGRIVTINDKIEFKQRSDRNGDDVYFNTNGKCGEALQEELYDNFDKCSNRYEAAIANIDDLIAKVISSKRNESMNGNSNIKENVSINTKSCCCNAKTPIIDEHRIENKFYKNESVENLIKNTDNQLDKYINFSHSVGGVVAKEKMRKRAKSLEKSGFLKIESKDDSCEKVQKFSRKYRCRSASAGSECYSSSSEDDNNGQNTQRGRSRVKRRQRQEKPLQDMQKDLGEGCLDDQYAFLSP